MKFISFILLILLAFGSLVFIANKYKGLSPLGETNKPVVVSITPTIDILPTNQVTVSLAPTDLMQCGGKRGLKCPDGYRCVIEDRGADLLGNCIK